MFKQIYIDGDEIEDDVEDDDDEDLDEINIRESLVNKYQKVLLLRIFQRVKKIILWIISGDYVVN